jgi:hypothetical protein
MESRNEKPSSVKKSQRRPYKLHTNRELSLMLKGEKPLAAFLYAEGEDEASNLSNQDFGTYVNKGVLLRDDHLFQAGPYLLHLVLFALPAEVWRFKAYHLMWEIFEKTKWNETLERMEGSLLGYTEAQNDWHIEHKFKIAAE